MSQNIILNEWNTNALLAGKLKAKNTFRSETMHIGPSPIPAKNATVYIITDGGKW